MLASAPMAGANLSGEVSTAEPYVVPAVGEKRFTVAALDLGIKANTPRMMAERGIETHVLPATATLDDVLAVSPDGLFFSNGPGDPAATTGAGRAAAAAHSSAGSPTSGSASATSSSAARSGSTPTSSTYGHRGINQPVMDRTTGKVEVTAHNHGFAVAGPARRRHQTPYGEATVSHVCLNDDVVEGLELRRDGRLVAFSVQYHPEAAAGPHDAAYLFDRFCDLLSPEQASTDGPDSARPSHAVSIGRATSRPRRRGRLMPKRDDIQSVLVIGVRADRDRAGLRVRLLRHPGVPRARGRRGSGSCW